MTQGRRTRHELRQGQAAATARKAREDAHRIRAAWDNYVATGAALAAITACTATDPAFNSDVEPVVCQLLAGHAPGEDNGGHRHRILGSRVVVEW